MRSPCCAPQLPMLLLASALAASQITQPLPRSRTPLPLVQAGHEFQFPLLP